MFDYTMLIYKKDFFADNGYRLVKTIRYENTTGNDMMNEIHFIRPNYPTKDGYLITFIETDCFATA